MESKEVNVDYEQYTGVTVNSITNVPDQIIKLGKRLIRVAKNSKKPIDSWSKISRDYIDDELTEHLQNNGNYGVKTGDGLIVVDLDSPEMVAKKYRFPRTFTVKTGKGFHLYYHIDNVKTHHGNGVDIQAEKAYVVGPNSIHSNGSTYTVIDNTDIVSTDINNLSQILNIPLPLLHSTIVQSTEHSSAHSKSNESEEGELVDPNDESRFGISEYYVREGLSFIEIENLHNLKAVKRRRITNNCAKEYYVTKGNVHKAPNGFLCDDVTLILTKTVIKSIRRTGYISKERLWLIIYRVSERYVATESVSESQYSEYLTMDESELVKIVPALRTALKSKLNNLKKYDKYKPMIEDLLHGVIDNKIDDPTMINLFYKAVELGKNDEEIHRMSETYFGTRYDKQETGAQIRHAKRKLET